MKGSKFAGQFICMIVRDNWQQTTPFPNSIYDQLKNNQYGLQVEISARSELLYLNTI